MKAFENNSQLLNVLGYGQLTNENVDNIDKFVCKVFEPSTGSQRFTKCEFFV